MVGLQQPARPLAAARAEVHSSPAHLTTHRRSSPRAPSRHALLDPKTTAAYREPIADRRQDFQVAEDNHDIE
jgi:hypothetical protein